MAIRGRFGRLPRTAPSLVSTIVALSQQYQNQRDTNIETAWKQGGLFEGKKVTDEMFMAHWQKRRDSVDQQDPMWDYYNNLIYNYTFTIAESKMGQKYAEGSVTDAQMRSFYHEWAAKLPKDSEAYRNLMTQAAKFKTAAAARGSGSNAKAAEAAYQKAQVDTYNKYERPFVTLTAILANYAASPDFHSILGSGDVKEADYGFSKLASVEGDPAAFANMLTDIQNSPNIMKWLTDTLRKPISQGGAGMTDFNGKLDLQTLVNMSGTARNGASISTGLAQKKGRKEDATAAGKRMGRYSNTGAIIGVSLGQPGHESFVTQNAFHRSRMDTVLNDPSATEMEKDQAMKEYRSWLHLDGTRLIEATQPPGAFDPQSPNYDINAAGIYGRLLHTIDALDGKNTGRTLTDDLYGQVQEAAGPESDAAKIAKGRNDTSFKLNAVANGTAIQIQTDGKGNPTADGTGWEIFPTDAPEVVGNDNLVPMVIPAHSTYSPTDSLKTPLLGGDKGEIRYIVARDVKVKAYEYIDPATGKYTGEVKPWEGFDPLVGKQVDFVIGGRTITAYGTYVGGVLVWSPHDPFGDQVGPPVKQADGTIAREITQGKTPSPTGPPLKVPGEPAPPPVGFDPHDPSIIPPENLANPTTGSGQVGPDGKPVPFQPITDKRMAWDSPFAAITNGSKPDMDFIAKQIGEKGMKAVETEWYKIQSHWTPQMMQQYSAEIARGDVDPGRAFMDTITGKVNELPVEVKFKQTTGFSPEDQEATRSRAAAAQTASDLRTSGAAEGLTPEQLLRAEQQARDVQMRNDLVTKVDQWGISGSKSQPFMVPGTLTTGDIPVPYTHALPTGWSAMDLLNQPGMSVAAANALAYQITHGAVGVAPVGGRAVGGSYAPGEPLPGQMVTGGNRYSHIVTGEPTVSSGSAAASVFTPRPGQRPSRTYGIPPGGMTGPMGPQGPGNGIQPNVAPLVKPKAEDAMALPRPFEPPPIDVQKFANNPEFRMPAPRIRDLPF